MSNTAVKAVDLSKSYVIRSTQAKGRTLQEDLVNLVKNLLVNPKAKARSEIVWALRDVSFEIKQGEVVGIIGRNGAGKSTLLKILSQITEPTSGYVDMYGRVGSLLEVGTGFHTELTGRENIYLGGAVLGMTHQEIKRKFDEIVDFSGIERFLDVPVKRYSSGMQVRLAFSVAAHLEPEILLIDEVLAVGDAEFQRKCLGKMDEVALGGRTVLFVSHDMGAITKLCRKTILIDSGKIVSFDETMNVVSKYLLDSRESANGEISLPNNLEKAMCLREIKVHNIRTKSSGRILRHEPIMVSVMYDVNQQTTGAHVLVYLETFDGTVILGTGDADTSTDMFGLRNPGSYLGEFEIPKSMLKAGIYSLTVSLGIPGANPFDRHRKIASFEVIDTIDTQNRTFDLKRKGFLDIQLPWITHRL